MPAIKPGLETAVGSKTKFRGWDSMRWHSGLSWVLLGYNLLLSYYCTCEHLLLLTEHLQSTYRVLTIPGLLSP